jgi:hypothetical protein
MHCSTTCTHSHGFHEFSGSVTRWRPRRRRRKHTSLFVVIWVMSEERNPAWNSRAHSFRFALPFRTDIITLGGLLQAYITIIIIIINIIIMCACVYIRARQTDRHMITIGSQQVYVRRRSCARVCVYILSVCFGGIPIAVVFDFSRRISFYTILSLSLCFPL